MDMIEIKDIFREENTRNCFKCGLSLNNPIFPHNEKECDYSPIKPEHLVERMKVEDIEIDDIKISAGYGIWEIAMISKIMMELQNRAMGLSTTRGPYGLGLELFNEAEKIYKKRLTDD